jgi:hypothetical protein
VLITVKHIEELEKVVLSREKTVLMLERSILADQSRVVESLSDTENEGVLTESETTKLLRQKLKEENEKVGELQELYRDQDNEHEKSLSLGAEEKILTKVMSSKFDLSNDNPLMTWLDVDEDELDEVEGTGDVEMMAAAEAIVLEVTAQFLEDAMRIKLLNRNATVLDLKKAIFAETGMRPEAQVITFDGLELGRDLESMEGYGLKSGDLIELEETSNPSMLAHGEASHSSRRQRLSISQQYEERLNSKSGDIWRRGTTLAMRDVVINRSKRAASIKMKGETLPLTGSLVDLLKEVRSAESSRQGIIVGGANANKAMVTFNSITAATIATQAVHSVPEHRQLLTVEEAPHSDDMFWANIHKGSATVRGLRAITSVLTFSLVVFFVLPVTYLNQFFGPAKMESLATKYNWHWMLKSVATTLLPMTLVIISNLLPPLFTGLGFFEGCLTWSLNGLRQFDRMMWFLLVNVYGVSIISGTIIESIVDILRNPTASASIIANVLPTM